MKTHKIIKLLFVSLLVTGFLFSCKKENKELTTVNFHIHNPVSGEGMAGVKVAVYELKDVTPSLAILPTSEYENNKIWEGVTDSDGKASHSFKAYKKDKYTYWHYVDESVVKTGNRKLLSQPEYGPLLKNTNNKITYKVVIDNLSYVRWVKNINCFDNDDKCRWRRKSIIDIYDSDWKPWSPLVGSPSYPQGFYEGCFEYTNTHTHTQDIWDIEMEVTKNGVTTIIRDTFYLTGQNGTDTLKLFY